MNAVHLHLMLNHVPVVGSILGLVLLVGGMLWKSEDVKKASLVIFLLSGLVAIPVYLTGEPTEEAVEAIPGVSEAAIEAHEEGALVTFIASLVLGVLAAVGLGLSWRKISPMWLMPSVVGLALVVCGLMAWTANSGGKIRHPEIMGSSQVQEGSHEGERHERDYDD